MVTQLRMSAAEYRNYVKTGKIPESLSTASTGVRPTGVGSVPPPGQRKSCLKGKNNHPEEDLQIACFDWIKASEESYPILKWIFHPPNGGYRSKAEAGRFKAMGVKSGVPDFLLPFPFGQFHGLAIELKSDTGTVSENQEEWLVFARKNGYLVGVVRSLEEFIAIVHQYLNADGQPADMSA